MAWTETTRAEHARSHAGYASDVTDAEWAVIGPGLPGPAPRGCPRTTDLRSVVNALFYMFDPAV